VKVTVAATQMQCTWDIPGNIERAENLIHQAADQGTQIILIQELFETPYFCIDEQNSHFQFAHSVDDHPMIAGMQALAKKLNVVLPISFFERAGQTHFNALVVIDADGEIISHYRKSHIPDAPGYEEKFYFSPGDTGFITVQTHFANIGVAICWDQWFPEAARIMVLKGAELLFYPTAIGSEINQPDLDSKDHWQTVMRGHSAANVVPVIASNRIGMEESYDRVLTFYGSSFITDHCGALIASADKETETIITASFDLEEIKSYRHSWGLFRDRRPDLYQSLLSLDRK